ncbi:MAG: hypothetical protein Q8909_01225 [Bacteroidota bacterium]|nr:hypothetical protein [Bacteroidota bacterium]
MKQCKKNTLIVILLFICLCDLLSENVDRNRNYTTKNEINALNLESGSSIIGDSDNKEKDLLLYLSLALNVFSLLGLSFVLLKQRRIREVVIEVVTSSERINSFIENKVSKPLFVSQERMTNKEVERFVDIALDRKVSTIMDEVRYCMNLDETERKNTNTQGFSKVTKEDDKYILYASAVNMETGSFHEVTMTPNENTIYLLRLKNKTEQECLFEVYENAHQAVIQSPNFLRLACDLQKVGSTRVVCVFGLAKKQAEGWVIIKKAKVKFE